MFLSRYIRGFTLTEALLAVTVLAILTSLAVPSFTYMVRSNQVKTTAESIYQFLGVARSEAIKLDSNVSVNIQTGSSWCVGSRASSTCNCNTAGNCNLNRIDNTQFGSSTVTVTGFNNGNITFDAKRGTVTESGTITVARGNFSIQINVNQMGTLSICSTEIGGYTSC